MSKFKHALTKFWENILLAFSFGESEEKIRNQTDEEAIAEDWQKIGQDMQTAIEKFEKQYGYKLKVKDKKYLTRG